MRYSLPIQIPPFLFSIIELILLAKTPLFAQNFGCAKKFLRLLGLFICSTVALISFLSLQGVSKADNRAAMTNLPLRPDSKTSKTEESRVPIKINNITFKGGKDGKETVFVHSSRFFRPIVFAIEGKRPRVVVDIKNTSHLRKGLSRISVNGGVIKRIRTHLHRDSDKLRIVLDLQPAYAYKVNQTFYEAQGSHVFVLEVEARKAPEKKEKPVEETEEPVGKLPTEGMAYEGMKDSPLYYGLKNEEARKIKLRATAQKVTEWNVKDILTKFNFYSSCWNYNGDFCNPAGEFGNVFSDHGDGTVIDATTGLIWQKRSSGKAMTWEEAGDYITGLNQKKLAGYSDWRLPTIEELASLVESSWKGGKMFLDPVFGNSHKSIWSADPNGPGKAWKANFHLGFVIDTHTDERNAVRAVRSRKSARSRKHKTPPR